jgi:hypothetical protein
MQKYAHVYTDRNIDTLYQHEVAIVWDADFTPSKHRYIRETVSGYESRRSGRIRHDGFRVVGWSVIKHWVSGSESSGHKGMFRRRVFWLKDYDATGPYAGCGAPVEGVDPLLIEAGRPGVMTERAWGGPFKPIDKAEYDQWLKRGTIVLLDANGKPIWDTYDAATLRGRS